MPDVTIEELAVPRTLDEPGGADFRASVEVRNANEADAFGTWELAVTPEYLLPKWNNPFEPKRLFLARVDGRVVGRAYYETRTDAASTTCWIDVDVHPDVADPAIADALHERMRRLAVADGRLTANVYVIHRETGSAERLVPPTGFGSVPADEASAAWLTRLGYTLGQVERISRLPLPIPTSELDAHLAAALAAAGDAYRVVRWVGRTPEEWVSGIAELNTRMSTDAPTGGMAEDEDPWDDERVRTDDELAASTSHRLLVSGVVHIPSGRLVAFNELEVAEEAGSTVMQQDTLVLAEHRGHRLGMVVKIANLLHLEEVAPGHPSVITWNAEENRHMLSVNEAVGFVPIGYEGGWTITL